MCQVGLNGKNARSMESEVEPLNPERLMVCRDELSSHLLSEMHRLQPTIKLHLGAEVTPSGPCAGDWTYTAIHTHAWLLLLTPGVNLMQHSTSTMSLHSLVHRKCGQTRYTGPQWNTPAVPQPQDDSQQLCRC